MARLRALFITDRWDAPYRYRCAHACAQLRAAGAIANVLPLEDERLLAGIEAYGVLVLFRLPWGPQVEAVVDAARRAGVPVVFDCDDLVFDPAAAPLLPFRDRYSEPEWQRSYAAQLRDLRRTFDACDSFVGSTPALVEWAAKLGKPARAHPNVVPDEYLRLAGWIERARPNLRSGPTIGYFSGSNTHDSDFETVASALRDVLDGSMNTRLVLGGHLDVRSALHGLEHRVFRLPHVSHRALPWAYAACDVTIAPSAVSNPFADGKSALKFFEPGAFRIPVIASPTAEMRSAIEHRTTGWLADGEREWRACLRAALEPGARERVGKAARQAVLQRHTSRAVAGRLAKLLGEVAVRTTGKDPPLLPFVRDEFGGRSDLLSLAAAQALRARDAAKITTMLRAANVGGPTPTGAERLVDQILRGIPPDQGVAVLLRGSPTESAWRAVSQIEPDRSPLGESKLTGSDPALASPPIDMGKSSFRYAVVCMRASADGASGNAQLFWQTGRKGGFREKASATFQVRTDGIDAVYVVDLWRDRAAGFPRRGPKRLHFRFDPLDRPGTARVQAIALVSDDWQPSSTGEPGDELQVHLGKRPRANLDRAVRELAVGEKRWFATQRDTNWLRALLRRRLADTGCEVERLVQRANGSFALVRRNAVAEERGVDIVVPVYNARQQTFRCLRSVLRHARGDFRLVVIDDASPDPKIWPALARFARDDRRVLLLRNPENLGFVGTCNRAFELAHGRDVLLLNSDTRVFRGFLGRLRDCAYADEHTGIVCPTSNNATICSVPEIGRSNELPAGMNSKQMALLVRKTSRKRRPELVTPVGFCMYVRAEVIADIGTFDAERFGRGFGEENDFGERAKARGWKIRLADDTYVWHEGKASFGEAGLALESKNAKVLEARHPGYHAAVAHFFRDNPLAPIHDELRWQLARWPHATKPAVMMLVQASPLREPCGGTEYVVRDLVKALRSPRVVIAWPGEHSIEAAEVLGGDLAKATVHRFPLETAVPRFCHDHAEARRMLAEIVELFRIAHVHIHHLMGWPLTLVRDLQAAGAPYSMTVHDFYGVCPNQNLIDPDTLRPCCPSRCDEPTQVTRCMGSLFAALALEPLANAPDFLREHRALFASTYANATKVFFPSPSAQRVVESVHGPLRGSAAVLPHAYVPAGARTDGVGPTAPTRTLRVAMVGEVSYRSKGADNYLELIRLLRGQPVEWHVFGPTERFDFEQRLTELEPEARIVRHGAYTRDDIVGLLRRSQIDVGVLLPVCAETFSLTLSELLAAQIPIIASRQGALADRLEDVAHGIVVDTPEEAARELSALCRDRARLGELRASLAVLKEPDVHAWVEAQRRTHQEQSRRLDGRPLRRRELRKLCDTRVSQSGLAQPVVSTIQAAARHSSSGWYRGAERLKPYLPESIRGLARRRLTDERYHVLQRFRLPGSRARPGPDLRLDARYLTTARYTSLGDDPTFVLVPSPVAPSEVGAIRFNLWCSHHGYTYAQIYWRHERDGTFTEDKSLTIEVNGALGDWQEYVVRLDPATHPSWFAGESLAELRFDPVNYSGLFCVGRLDLCAVAPRE